MRFQLLRLLPGVLLLSILTGCESDARIKGGSVYHASPTGSITQLQQSQDPQAPSTIDNSSERTMSFTLPAGSKINVNNASMTNLQASGAASSKGDSFQAVVTSDTPVTITVKDSLKTSNGAAQKNVLGEMIEKLKSMRWIQGVGILMFLFGIATIAVPWLRALLGSITTSVWIIAGGLALIVLPVLIVGNELLILCCVAAAVGIWFLAHRHGVMSAVANGLQPGKISSSATTPLAGTVPAPAATPASPATAAPATATAVVIESKSATP